MEIFLDYAGGLFPIASNLNLEIWRSFRKDTTK